MKDFEDLPLDYIYDLFIELNLCSEEALNLVTSINGYNDDTMKDILYATTGLRNLEQMINEFNLTPEDYPELFEEDDEE